MNNISGKAKLAGVMGWPVAHSFSPRLHQFWLDQYNIDGAYIPLCVHPKNLHEAVLALPKLGFSGFNVTIPHKESILPFLDSLDTPAQAIGAVNTVVIDSEGKLHGSNSDAYGFSTNIHSHLPAIYKKAVILGAGGAARAVCYALQELGFSELTIVNRTHGKAKEVAASFPGASAAVWESRWQALADCDLLVNTTSLGMDGKEFLDIDLSLLPKSALVTDIVYNPLITPLLKHARQQHYAIIDGLGMLLHQAVPGFSAWFGVHPEVTPDLRHHVLG